MNNKVEAVIEIPLNSRNKFEIDEKTKKIKLDRVLYSAMSYPAEYGFIDNTLSDDGDPLDILVITNSPTFPGCIVPARILGYLKVIDNGYDDYKLISVVDVDPRFREIESLKDLSKFRLEEIKNFFENYKKLQNIKVVVENYHGKEEAMELLKYCREKYKNKGEKKWNRFVFQQ